MKNPGKSKRFPWLLDALFRSGVFFWGADSCKNTINNTMENHPVVGNFVEDTLGRKTIIYPHIRNSSLIQRGPLLVVNGVITVIHDLINGVGVHLITSRGPPSIHVFFSGLVTELVTESINPNLLTLKQTSSNQSSSLIFRSLPIYLEPGVVTVT